MPARGVQGRAPLMHIHHHLDLMRENLPAARIHRRRDHDMPRQILLRLVFAALALDAALDQALARREVGRENEGDRAKANGKKNERPHLLKGTLSGNIARTRHAANVAVRGL